MQAFKSTGWSSASYFKLFEIQLVETCTQVHKQAAGNAKSTQPGGHRAHTPACFSGSAVCLVTAASKEKVRTNWLVIQRAMPHLPTAPLPPL